MNIFNNSKKLIFSIITVFCASLFLMGCGKDKSMKDEEIANIFLEQVFSTDYENRYTEFLKDQDVDKYYETFSEYVSESCIENLKNNRTPVKYEKEAASEEILYVVSDIKLKFNEDGSADFELLLADKNNTEKDIKKATGQISIIDKKVDRFFLNKIVDIE